MTLFKDKLTIKWTGFCGGAPGLRVIAVHILSMDHCESLQFYPGHGEATFVITEDESTGDIAADVCEMLKTNGVRTLTWESGSHEADGSWTRNAAT